MSHLNAFKTEMTDQEALIRALGRMGIKRQHIEVHQNAQPMTDYYGSAEKRANLIIRKGHTTIPSDIGWELSQGTYVAHLDEHDYTGSGWVRNGGGPGSTIYNQRWSTNLLDYYNVERSKMALEAKGIAYTETRDQQNRIQLRAKFKTGANSSSLIQARS